MFLVYPRVRGLTWKITRTPTWDTLAQRMSSGKEFRLRYWNNPLWKWDLEYEYLKDTPNDLMSGASDTDFVTLQGFFLQMAGQYQPFLFDDVNAGDTPGSGPWDSVEGQVIGSGDGVTTKFPLLRTTGGFPEWIQAPFSADGASDPPAVYLNGVRKTYGTHFSIDAYGNIVFATPPLNSPPTLITADFSYYFPVRFGTDDLDMETMFYEMWSLKKLTLQQVRL
jgi:uncharacterized protein (TIGR02217 family)